MSVLNENRGKIRLGEGSRWDDGMYVFFFSLEVFFVWVFGQGRNQLVSVIFEDTVFNDYL